MSELFLYAGSLHCRLVKAMGMKVLDLRPLPASSHMLKNLLHIFFIICKKNYLAETYKNYFQTY